MESTDARKKALEHWLFAMDELQPHQIVPMQNDASFRRYFRVATKKGSFVAMDAIPTKENCQAYIAIAHALREMNLQTPEIFAADLAQGFLLISDFGDKTYLKILNDQNADQLYKNALNVLAVLQNCRKVKEFTIPPFNASFMQQEWLWHKEWFLSGLLGLNTDSNRHLDICYKLLVDSASNQPQVFMHRDYHSANLMVLPNNVGVLDFQDAFMGPVTYDLVSLLRDCYIDWSEEQVTRWVFYYWELLVKLNVVNVDEKEFMRWFDWMGMQRHLKALLTFARKKVRDHQPQYLKYVPRTLKYLISVSGRYSAFSPLQDYLLDNVMPAFERTASLCAP